ncbi:sulfite exporter TauE/SafE family protein [Rhodobacteraceae bacterium KMM 6894]|nr:sulfite exporter TauE/SafE family protein [Rhodobacteraceae bacterium KMM 6894]
MEILSGLGPPNLWMMVFVIALGAGLVKGVVGFAMPVILISGLSSLMSPDLALACLIVPTVLTNAWQALRQGWREALGSLRRFRVFMAAGGVVMVASAQLVPVLPPSVMLLVIGVPVTAYALSALMGRALRLPPNPGWRIEAGIGAVAGFLGGMTGVWGPITVAMLTAMQTSKRDQVRVQGVIYGMGAVVLAAAHWGSGVLNAQTLPLSLALVVPSLIGVWIGFQVQDRIDHVLFRRLTLLVLLLAGLNLLRRGVLAI